MSWLNLEKYIFYTPPELAFVLLSFCRQWDETRALRMQKTCILGVNFQSVLSDKCSDKDLDLVHVDQWLQRTSFTGHYCVYVTDKVSSSSSFFFLLPALHCTAQHKQSASSRPCPHVSQPSFMPHCAIDPLVLCVSITFCLTCVSHKPLA